MALTLISTPLDITVSDTAVATVSITSGIDDTYDSYEFHCVGIHPSGASLPNFVFQVGTAAESGYDRNMTTAYFAAANQVSGTWTGLYYSANEDQQNSAQVFQMLAHGAGDENDDSSAVILKLYEPSSTTYVKHFVSVAQMNHHNSSNYQLNSYASGYINTTAAITRIQFKFDAGNIDAGTIKMFGVT